MNNVHPIFESATYYQIEVRGRVDVDWLQSFDGSAEIRVDETRQMEDITMLKGECRSIGDGRAGAQAARAGNDDPAITDRVKRRESR